MTKKIQPLSSSVVKKLRSGIALTSISHCIEELILNSIDAGSNCIAVHLNLPFCRIQVIDNGCGIDLEQLKIIGTRYATSKCHTLEDLQNLKCGGFRGEALSSLKEVSSILMIESRTASSKETYCKIFTQGKSSDPKKSLNSRPSKGTTISVYDFMYNMPVRKSTFSNALDLEDCRKCLQSIALMQPDISFTLKNEATGEMCLQLKKCNTLYHAFFQMFGQVKANNLKNIDYQVDCYELNGYINTDCHVNKDLQFLYVNKRLVLRTKLHKLINSILNKVLSSKKSKYDASNSSSPSKIQTQYCVFILNISCPYDRYDILFEPRKTIIEFSEWEKVLKIVEDAMMNFLKKENLYCSSDQTESSLPNSVSNENKNLPNFDTHDCRQGLFSHVARRLQICEESNDICRHTAVDQNMEVSVPNILSDDNFTTDKSKNLIVSNCNNVIPSVESNYMNSEKSVASVGKSSSIICLRTDASNVSVLDKLKSATTSNVIKLATANPNILTDTCDSHQPKTEYDIPCRSIFPSESPVMMRVPVKSTLTDLQTSYNNTNLLLKLKEKFQYSPKKKNILSREKKNYKKNEFLQKSNHKSKLILKNHLTQNSSHFHFDQEKHLKDNEVHSHFKDKSAQCPSVALHYQSLPNNQLKNVSVQDKSLQCPSVSSAEKNSSVSKFEFRKEPVIFALQRVKRSSRLETKTQKFFFAENHIITADDLINNEHEMFKSKKRKSFHDEVSPREILNDEIVSEKNNRSEAFPDSIKDSDAEHPRKFQSSPDFNRLSEAAYATSLDDVCQVSLVKHTQNSNLHQFDLSSFSLHAFAQNKDTDSVSCNNVFKNIEISRFHQTHDSVDTFVGNLSKNKSSGQTYLFQKPSPVGELVGISSSDEVLQIEPHLSNIESDLNLKEFRCMSGANEMRDEIKSDVNYVLEDYPDQMLPNSEEVKSNLLSTNFSSKSNSLLNFQVKDFDLSSNDTNAENELSPVIEFQYKSVNILPNQNTSDKISLLISSDVADINKAISDKSDISNSEMILHCDNNLKSSSDFPPSVCNSAPVETNDAKDSFESSMNCENPTTDLASQYLHLETDFSELQNVNMIAPDNVPENNLPSGIDLESIPFSECPPPLSNNAVSEQNSSKEIFDSIVSKESSVTHQVCYDLPMESSFSELPKLEEKLSSNLSEISNTSDSDIIISKKVCTCDSEKDKSQKSNKNVQNISSSSIGINHSSNSSKLDKTECSPSSPNKDVNYYTSLHTNINEKESNNSEQHKSHWKAHSEPETNRIIYIDTKTGNSAYIAPKEKCITKDQNEDTKSDTNIEGMLTSWDNPMFHIPYEVACAGENKISQNLPQMYTFLNSYKFSWSTLKSLQVIGQVDCKFIACILQNYNENCKDQKLFALFDQHAVHERIRLEELIEDLYEIDQNGKKSVKSSAIDPPLKVSFDSEEIRLLSSYNESLHQIGIHLTIDNKSQVCAVHSVPLCLVDKESKEFRRNRSDSTAILQNSISEWLASLLKTRSIPQVLPRTLLSILNYQACRGAVKFGDPLNLDQCKALLESLSKCQLPFQCAHGRPSVAPILDLNKIEALYKKKPPPQLRNISMHLKGQCQS